MYNLTLFNFQIYYLALYFIIFSFSGWLMETIRVSLRTKKFINRGFINGPFCPIYGIGMILIIVFLNDLKDNIIILILSGILLSSSLEYITSYLLEKIFNAKWWDYSYRKFNLKGRICLDISCIWGLLSFIMIKYVVPFINYYINIIPRNFGEFVINVFFIVFFIDLIFTIYSLLSLKTIITKLNSLKIETKELLLEFFSDFKEQFDTDEVKSKLDNLISNYMKDTINFKEIKEEFILKVKNINDKYFENINDKFNLQIKLDNFKNKYNKIYNKKINFVYKRIFNAFPKFHSINKESDKIIEELKEIFKHYKNNIKKNK